MNIWTLRLLGLILCLLFFGLLFRSWLNPPTPKFITNSNQTITIPEAPELTLQSTEVNSRELKTDAPVENKNDQKIESIQSEKVAEINNAINPTNNKKSFIQVGAFSEKTNAQNVVETLKDNKFKPIVETVEVNKKTLHRVVIGPIQESQAKQMLEDLKVIGIEEAKHIHR